MDKPKVLRNSLKIVQQVLTSSVPKIFGFEGIVTAQKYTKSEEFDFQSPYSMMLFKQVQKNYKEKEFKTPEELTEFLKEKLFVEYKNTFKKVETFQNLLLLEIHDDFIQEEINTLIKFGVHVE